MLAAAMTRFAVSSTYISLDLNLYNSVVLVIYSLSLDIYFIFDISQDMGHPISPLINKIEIIDVCETPLKR